MGFKPTTSALPALRSNQLSYVPEPNYSNRVDVKNKSVAVIGAQAVTMEV